MSRLAHPALAAGLAVVSTEDGLLIEGGPSRRLFTGARLPRLDRTRAADPDAPLRSAQLPA